MNQHSDGHDTSGGHEGDHEFPTPNGQLLANISRAACAIYGPVNTQRYGFQGGVVRISISRALLKLGGDTEAQPVTEYHVVSDRLPSGQPYDTHDINVRPGVLTDIGRVVILKMNDPDNTNQYASVTWQQGSVATTVFVGPHESIVEMGQRIQHEGGRGATGRVTYCSDPDSEGLSAMLAFSREDRQALRYLELAGGQAALATAVEYAGYVLDRVHQLRQGSEDEHPAI